MHSPSLKWLDQSFVLTQVLVSIQSLILVPDPYFNEPGFEQDIGTEAGKKHSDDYNEGWLNAIHMTICCKYYQEGWLNNYNKGLL